MDDLITWLLNEGRRHHDVTDLLDDFAPRLAADNAVDRMWAGTTVLHPQAAAYGWIWEDGHTRMREFTFDALSLASQEDSPLRRIRNGARALRMRRSDHLDTPMPVVRELWEDGYTDYFAHGLYFRGEWKGAFTFSSRRPGGFSDDDVARLTAMVPALSAIMEPIVRDAMYALLLRTYLGTDAGNRVVSGEVRRGDGHEEQAAIWFSDVRGFTALSAAHPRAVVLAVLDDVFEAVVQCVQHEGGQVLKFMGDGVLALFTGADESTRATRAALALQARLRDLRAERRTAGLPEPRVGVGLHHGELMYGNIGAPRRLDFTVIGPSVNLAARVEGLCSGLNEEVLATHAFAARTTGWAAVAERSVKGVEAPVVVYRPTGVASATMEA